MKKKIVRKVEYYLKSKAESEIEIVSLHIFINNTKPFFPLLEIKTYLNEK